MGLNTSTCVQTITIEDIGSPTFTQPTDITINCEDDIDDLSITGNVTGVSDNCGIQDTTYVDDTTAQTGCNNTGTVIRTWTVTDNCGNTASLTQTITIQDIPFNKCKNTSSIHHISFLRMGCLCTCTQHPFFL